MFADRLPAPAEESPAGDRSKRTRTSCEDPIVLSDEDDDAGNISVPTDHPRRAYAHNYGSSPGFHRARENVFESSRDRAWRETQERAAAHEKEAASVRIQRELEERLRKRKEEREAEGRTRKQTRTEEGASSRGSGNVSPRLAGNATSDLPNVAVMQSRVMDAVLDQYGEYMTRRERRTIEESLGSGDTGLTRLHNRIVAELRVSRKARR